jgi:phosphatidylinositol kinase/protein kinase (PI-3  family)
LIGILCRRTAAQRAAIRRAYAFLYREPLLNCFRYKLSRHHLLSVDFWVLPPFTRQDSACAQFPAKKLNFQVDAEL